VKDKIQDLHTYFQAASPPLQPAVRVAPLIFYQVLAALAPAGPGGMGVRKWRRRPFSRPYSSGSRRLGPRLFMVCLIGAGGWLIARTCAPTATCHPPCSAHAARVGRTLAGVRCVSAASRRVARYPLPPMALGSNRPAEPLDDADVIPGRRIYEELLFRVVLVGLSRGARKKLLGWRPLIAALPRRARRAHFLRLPLYRPWGSPRVFSFVFRTIAGCFQRPDLLRGFA